MSRKHERALEHIEALERELFPSFDVGVGSLAILRMAGGTQVSIASGSVCSGVFLSADDAPDPDE